MKNDNKLIIQGHLKSGTQNLAIFHHFWDFLALKTYRNNKILQFFLLFHNLHCVRKKTWHHFWYLAKNWWSYEFWSILAATFSRSMDRGLSSLALLLGWARKERLEYMTEKMKLSSIIVVTTYLRSTTPRKSGYHILLISSLVNGLVNERAVRKEKSHHHLQMF